MKIGIQTFSLRAFPPDEALDMIAALGCGYVEPHWPHGEITSGMLDEFAPIAYGVPCVQIAWTNTKAAMEMAVRLGVPVVNVDVELGAWPLLYRCVKDFGLKVAVHPHGPTHRIPGWRYVRDMTYGSPLDVGICIDNGHIARTGEDPIDAVLKMPERVHSVHLKDQDAEGHDVPLGCGVLDVKGLLHALQDMQFKGPVAIEWEGEEKNPLPGLRLGLAYVADVLGSPFVHADHEGAEL